MEMTLRRAAVSDVESLCALYVSFHNFHARGVSGYLRLVGAPDQELRDAVLRILNDPEAAVFLAVTQADEPVGFAEIYTKERSAVPGVVAHRYGLLQSLFVTAEQRGAGIGAQLVAAAQAWALAQGATEVKLETWEFPEGPLHFYERLGYTTVRRQLVWRPTGES